MNLIKIKQLLDAASELNFMQPNGIFVPKHFHITEAGLTTKHFMDCGGTIRTEKVISFQVWVATDVEHRLEPQKLRKIIEANETLFETEDLEVEVEYQTDTIGRYGLDFNGQFFLLTPKQTSCLAQAECGVPQEKQKVALSDLLLSQTSCCSPGGGCC